MDETYINPSPDQMKAIAALDLDGPIVMLNLLRFAPDGGAEEYARYSAAAMPFLREAGAVVPYLGDGVATVIGPDAWDEVILVEYPSVRAFLGMVGHPDYPSALREGALTDSRLYCTQRRST